MGFAEFAHRSGESGLMRHLACFFKAPLGEGTHAFFPQFAALMQYAQERATAGAPVRSDG